MAVTKTRGTSKKLGPIKKIVSFRIPNLTRQFTVHQDLICETSNFFKSRFQAKRKPVRDTCSICFDTLTSTAKDVTFCEACGQNIHQECIKKWLAARDTANEPPTCPMCRTHWSGVDDLLDCVQLSHELDSDAVQIYIDWLYTGTVCVGASVSRLTETFNIILLKCWEVSTTVEDTAFREAIKRTFFTEAKAQFWSDSVDFAFEEGKGSDEMRGFILNIFMTRLNPGWFKLESAKWPRVFVQALADKIMDRAPIDPKEFVALKSACLKPTKDSDKEKGKVDRETTVRGLLSDTEDDEDDDSDDGTDSSSGSDDVVYIGNNDADYIDGNDDHDDTDDKSNDDEKHDDTNDILPENLSRRSQRIIEISQQAHNTRQVPTPVEANVIATTTVTPAPAPASLSRYSQLHSRPSQYAHNTGQVATPVGVNMIPTTALTPGPWKLSRELQPRTITSQNTRGARQVPTQVRAITTTEAIAAPRPLEQLTVLPNFLDYLGEQSRRRSETLRRNSENNLHSRQS